MKSKWESEKDNLIQLILVEKLSYEEVGRSRKKQEEDMDVQEVTLRKQQVDQDQNQNREEL